MNGTALTANQPPTVLLVSFIRPPPPAQPSMQAGGMYGEDTPRS